MTKTHIKRSVQGKPASGHNKINLQAMHGLTACLCGCSRTFKTTRNRNGTSKEYFSDRCRADYNSRARNIGRRVIKSGVDEADIQAAISRVVMLPARKQRQEYVDLENMRTQERLGFLCRAAERCGVIS